MNSQVVLSQNGFDLEYILRNLHQEHKKLGIHINLNKLTQIGNHIRVKQIEKYRYFGAMIDKNGLRERIEYSKIRKLWELKELVDEK